MRRLILKPLLLGLVGAVAGAAVVVHGQQQPAADLVLTNGKIITVDNKFTIAQAVAIRGDRFVAVGSNADINKLAGPNTRRIDLGGKAVIPGRFLYGQTLVQTDPQPATDNDNITTRRNANDTNGCQ